MIYIYNTFHFSGRLVTITEYFDSCVTPTPSLKHVQRCLYSIYDSEVVVVLLLITIYSFM